MAKVISLLLLLVFVVLLCFGLVKLKDRVHFVISRERVRRRKKERKKLKKNLAILVRP